MNHRTDIVRLASIIALIILMLAIPLLSRAATDVIVVGAGGAGLSAAIEAHDAGATVVVLEKMPIVGGNTNYATGGINAAGTSFQKAKGINDSQQLMFDDTMKGGKQLNNPELVRVLTTQAKDAVDWLTSLGADLTDVGRLGGHSVNRSHRPTGGAAVGREVVATLKKAAKERGIDIRTAHRVTALISEKGKVTGVHYVDRRKREGDIKAPAIVLATGGFGASQEKIVRYDPKLKGFGTTNHKGATGDGIDLGQAVGAAFVDLKQIQIHPSVAVGKGLLITEAVRGNGAILVNREGARFIDELTTRDVVSAAILEQTEASAFLIFDQGVRESLKAIEKYVRLRLVIEAPTLEALGGKIGVKGGPLTATVKRYNAAVKAGADKEFKRTSMARPINKGPYYAIEVAPAVHHTMGGLKIDTRARVICNKGKPIPGLYAAGEATGGVHGANRLGGNALADIIVFGRIAGREAAGRK